MVELLIVACLLAEPKHCEQFHIPFLEPMTVVQCMYRSETQLTQWVAEHSDWVLRRWSCSLPRA